MSNFGNEEHIKIDIAHAMLLSGLVAAHKPRSILEFGIGGGRSTDAILSAAKYNDNNFTYTLVDSWLDFGYICPQEVIDKYSNDIEIVTSDEKDFVFSTKRSFDFIMSDADHTNTDKWFQHIYLNLLNKNGILIYHDIDIIHKGYPNLITIYEKCKELKLLHLLFNKSTLPNERCHRGLLVIIKQ